ncbi:MAG: MarR family transcriptional regulator [Litorimonas sp.]
MPRNPSILRYREDLVGFADVAFQMLSVQISANYLGYIKARVIPELGEFSSSPLRELRTLMTIAHFADPITGSRISRILSYDPATVSRSTKWLIENGLVTVKENTEDARSVLYGLTPEGLELSDMYRDLTRQSIAELNDADPEHPSPKEILKALTVLEKVRDRSQHAAKLGAEYKRQRKRKT